MDGTKTAYNKLVAKIATLKDGGEIDKEQFDALKQRFTDAMDNDLNTALAITALYDVLKAKTSDATKLALIRDFETVLDLGLIEEAAKVAELQAAAKAAAAVTEWVITCETPGLDEAFMAEVEGLIQARADAKKAKDFAKADEIRDTLTGMGVTLKDSKGGVSWTKNN